MQRLGIARRSTRARRPGAPTWCCCGAGRPRRTSSITRLRIWWTRWWAPRS